MKYLVIASFFFTSACSSIELKSTKSIPKNSSAKRMISNTGGVRPIARCVLSGVTTANKTIVIEKKILTERQLLNTDDYGRKGIYFDVFATGGFRLYMSSDSSTFSVVVDAEDTGVLQDLSYDGLPFVVHQPTRIEIESSVINLVSLNCQSF